MPLPDASPGRARRTTKDPKTQSNNAAASTTVLTARPLNDHLQGFMMEVLDKYNPVNHGIAVPAQGAGAGGAACRGNQVYEAFMKAFDSLPLATVLQGNVSRDWCPLDCPRSKWFGCAHLVETLVSSNSGVCGAWWSL